jgi:hypothetical protein
VEQWVSCLAQDQDWADTGVIFARRHAVKELKRKMQEMQ